VTLYCGRKAGYVFREERIRKIHLNSDKYFQCGLCKNAKIKTYRVHRLVAEAFIPNPDNKPEINHINTNKRDNSPQNLEWCTHAENMNHGAKHKLFVSCKPNMGNFGVKSGTSKLLGQFTEGGEMVNIYWGASEAARNLGLNFFNLSHAARKHTLTGGYRWEYAHGYNK
jgi:hypothetical protein